ncbi:MAG: insulinase family protein [Clostridia bacterium]|nr:insulinase family protein [Clostridia bacterium]
MKTTEFKSELLRERYLRIDHPGGLSVYVFPKKMSGTYALLSTAYGSIDNAFCIHGEHVEVPDGIAHFLEHKLFENEDGSDSFGRFSALGADANAYTSYQRTAYLFSCTGNFEAALEELITFVTHPYFTEASVKKEQGIIAEEIRMYEDHPWDRAQRNLLCAMYHANPVRKNICGSYASIQRITPELLYRCHEVFYHPSNLTLVVCGDVTPEQVMAVVERALPPSTPAPLPERILPQEPPTVAKREIRCFMQVAKPLFYIGVKDPVIPATPAERLRRDAALTLLDEILFSRSGPFYNELFEEGLITPAFYGGYSSTDRFAYHCISGEADDPHLVLERFWSYLARMQREGIDPMTFERCRRALYADEICAYDSTEEIANRLISFVQDGSEMFSYPALLQSITKEELEEYLRTVFREEYVSLSAVYPLEQKNEEVMTNA